MNRKSILLLDGVLILCGLFAPLLAKFLISLPIDCFVQEMGMLCPACGGTRCVSLVFQGRFTEAFWMNPYIFLTGIFAGMIIGLIHLTVLIDKDCFRKFSSHILRYRTVIVWAIGFGLFGILRNFI